MEFSPTDIFTIPSCKDTLRETIPSSPPNLNVLTLSSQLYKNAGKSLPNQINAINKKIQCLELSIASIILFFLE